MLFIRKLDVRKITFGEVNTVPTNENEKFYLCLLGMPKSFTSSTSVYLKENYNLDFPNSNGAKEEESLLRPNFKIKHCKGDIVDATQSYLFQDDFFKNFYSINRKKYILIQLHSYLATYFYGHRIRNFLSTTGIKEFVVIKFEDLIGNPNETLQKIGERYSFKINPIFKKPNETARWATKEKTISINDFARKTLNKLYTYDDDILDRYREKFLDV